MTLAGMARARAGRRSMYLEDRLDNISNCDHHGSDRLYDVRARAEARRHDARHSSSRSVDDYGAYFQFGVGTHGNSLCQIVGPYRINSVQMGSSRC